MIIRNPPLAITGMSLVEKVLKTPSVVTKISRREIGELSRLGRNRAPNPPKKKRGRGATFLFSKACLCLALLLICCSAAFAAGRTYVGGEEGERPGLKVKVPFGREYKYRVRWVIDGDTVVLNNGEKLRYIGIDTPELYHPKKPVEYLAQEAKELNERLVLDKVVKLEFDVEKRDKYGRLLAYAYLEDGTFVNAELIRQGYAQILTIPPNVKYVDLFLRLQREARENNRGLWAR